MLGTKHLLTTLALCVMGLSASAQDVIPVDSIRYAGRYDVATQTFHPSTTQPDTSQYAGTPVVLFNNTATNGSLFVGNGATEHFLDWGTANFGGGGASVTEIQIGYATNLQAPGTVALRVRLYQGAAGFGVPGTVVGDYALTGLPNSASGGFEGFFIDVTLPAAVPMTDGAIGWSYNSDASDPSGTGPLLVGPPNAAGVQDAFDRYLEADESYIGTSFFGGAPFASFPMRLTGTPNVVPVNAFEKYGATKKVIVLSGTGPGTPDSDNEVKIKSTIPGKPVVLMVGIVQSDIFVANFNMQFYALPWLIQLGPFVPNPASATVLLPFTIPSLGVVNPGEEVFMQSFGQNLAGQWVNYSKGLKLTIQ